MRRRNPENKICQRATEPGYSVHPLLEMANSEAGLEKSTENFGLEDEEGFSWGVMGDK